MNDHEKSHTVVVPAKSRNKEAEAQADATADGMEGRTVPKGNSTKGDMCRTQSRESMTSALGRVREVARRNPKMRFTALLHHVTIERLSSAYGQLRKRAAAGVDGVRWDEYGERLEENIRELHVRIHQGGYRPQPSRRVFIEKADGSQRALGIAAVEDKIAQRAVAEVLNAIYEEDFLGFCYGFRAGKILRRAPQGSHSKLGGNSQRRDRHIVRVERRVRGDGRTGRSRRASRACRRLERCRV